MKNSNQPIKRNMLMTMILALTSAFKFNKTTVATTNKSGSANFGNPEFVSKRTKFKGYMRNSGMSSRERKNWKR